MKDQATYVAAWPEERTAVRLERCRVLLVVAGLIGGKVSGKISKTIKRRAGLKNRRVR